MNPLLAADAGVMRTAVPSECPASATNTPHDAADWIRGLPHLPETAAGRRVSDSGSGYAVVLVDADSTRRQNRRANLTAGAGARVITASDEFDVADALRLLDPDAVIVSASDAVLGAKLIRAVRAQFDAHHEPVPVIAWQSRLGLHGTPGELLDAGADAVLADDTDADTVFATVRAMRRVIASATRRSARELVPTSSVLDALTQGLALIDRDGRVRDANAAMHAMWREMTGLRTSPVGGDLANLLVPADRAVLADAIVALFAAAPGTAAEYECTMGATPVRGIPVQVRLARLDDSSQGPVVVAEVTDQREYRRAAEVMRASRWRALDRQQTLDLSSRLRGLLSAMSQSLAPLAGHRPAGATGLSSTHTAMLRGTLAQSEQLLDALQAIATDQEHPAALVDVCGMVDTHLELFRQMLPDHVQLTWEAGASSLLVRGSEPQLQQALTALIMNAWDAQRSGGVIHVSVRHTDDVIVLGVEDNGPGVPEERHEWIFQPMTTTRAAEGASGLGLVTARRVVEMHGGQLRLDRYREFGARFEIVLPRYRSRAQSARVAPPRAVASRPVAAGI